MTAPVSTLHAAIAYAARVRGGFTALLLVADLGIRFNYAERLSRSRGTPWTVAEFVASTHAEVTFQTADGLALKG